VPTAVRRLSPASTNVRVASSIIEMSEEKAAKASPRTNSPANRLPSGMRVNSCGIQMKASPSKAPAPSLPLLVAAMRGKRQMLPVPTAMPSTLSSNPHREEKRRADASEAVRLS